MPIPTDPGPAQPFAKPDNSKVREREHNFKRITGIIACAECRRLRLRCDRKIPCSTCVRRGCKSVCPTGTMRTGSTANQALLGKISAISSKPISIKQALAEFSLTSMSNRICALEEALGIEVAEDHPLLSPELLAIKQGVNFNVYGKNEQYVHDMTPEGGTLSISEETGMRFLGASAAEASLLLDVLRDEPQEPRSDINLPPEIMLASMLFPFTPVAFSRPEIIALLLAHLPPYERAAVHLEGYFKSQSFFMSPVICDQMEELLRRFYPGEARIKAESFPEEDLHELALFFIIMSNGFIGDITKLTDSPEAEMYMYLGRAALGLRSVFEHGTMASVQAIFAMVSFYTQHLRLSYHEAAWKVMDLGLTIAMSIGLHLDPERWKLDPETSNLRRHLFWEINVSDKWRAIQSGRPQYFSVASYDCAFPTDDGAVINDDGTVVESVMRWRHRFCRDVIAPITESMGAVDQMDYAKVLKLDKLLRDFEPHPYAFTSYPVPSWSFGPPHLERHLRRSRPFIHPISSVFGKEQAIQYLHRNFFARVMLDPSRQNPFHSLYAPSFLATYRSAVFSLHLCFDAARRFPGNLHRLNGLWTYALPCAVVCGAVACRGTLTGFGEAAFAELNKTIDVFELAHSAVIPRNSLPTLYRMRDKAREALRASKLSRYYVSDSSSAFALSAFCTPDSTEDVDSRPGTSASGVADPGTPADSERSQTRSGLDGLSLDIDKPIEELLILLGASRLHIDKDEAHSPKSDHDQGTDSRRHSRISSTLSERSASRSHMHKPYNGSNDTPLFERSTPSFGGANVKAGSPTPTISSEGTFAINAFGVGETFPSFADPMILEMLSSDSLGNGVDVETGVGVPPGSGSGSGSNGTGGGAGRGQEAASTWQRFMAEMDVLHLARNSQAQAPDDMGARPQETHNSDYLEYLHQHEYHRLPTPPPFQTPAQSLAAQQQQRQHQQQQQQQQQHHITHPDYYLGQELLYY